MVCFNTRSVAIDVQKTFANKFLGNKVVAKGLLDDMSAELLDSFQLLLLAYVSVRH
jgi:hypothetical protein